MTETLDNTIVKQLAERAGVSEEEAEKQLTDTLNDPEYLNKIQEQINADMRQRAENARPMNREQRRKLMKKAGKAGRKQISAVSDTAIKLNYAKLIQDLRELNKKKENENYEDSNEDN